MDYSLLILKYGGVNLSEFAKKMTFATSTKANADKMTRFWTEAVRLFEGIAVFSQHKLIHHDIKPDNIVYSQETNRLNYIDFGLMQKSNLVYKDCQKSNYWLASKMHWSFPFEIMYLQKDKYMSFANLSEREKIKHFDDIILSFDSPDNYIANIIKE